LRECAHERPAQFVRRKETRFPGLASWQPRTTCAHLADEHTSLGREMAGTSFSILP
jgi:hypothetical protein